MLTKPCVRGLGHCGETFLTMGSDFLKGKPNINNLNAVMYLRARIILAKYSPLK
jgi:hypothetical protein